MRKIIHIDMDAFYASVEQRDNPSFRGKPVVVGGSPHSRSVVCSASYEARKFGVRSAMSCYHAKKLCPQAIFLFPRIPTYYNVSMQIMEIFHRFSDKVEPLSLDEAYIDVTEASKQYGSATNIANKIRSLIVEETGLTASAGVARTKFLAKVASGFQKPNAITVIPPKKESEFLDNLSIGKFYGIGSVSEKKLLSLGIKTGLDIKSFPLEELVQHLGKMGLYLYQIVRGIDNREVVTEHVRKSVGVERTFEKDLDNATELKEKLDVLVDSLWKRLVRSNTWGKVLTLKIKYEDFEQITRRHSYSYFLNDPNAIKLECKRLFDATFTNQKKIRLLGLSISGLLDQEDRTLFDN